MSPILAERPIPAHLERPKNHTSAMAKADLRKPKAAGSDADTQASLAVVASVVTRVQELSGLNLDQFADRLGKNPRQVAYWKNATERPHFDAIERVAEFKPLLTIAWAEALGCAAIETTIKVPLRRIG